MNNEDITKIAYERYKLKWMLDHGYTLRHLMTELDMMLEEFEDNDMDQIFDDWEFGYGFGSEIWSCYDEFMETEFLNSDYMSDILITASEWRAYIEYRTGE